MTLAATPGTKSRILDIAEHLVQTRGFNAFSYADIAAALRLTKASLHHHFPTKALLGEQLIARYQQAFVARLGQIDTSGGDADAKLRAYVEIYIALLDSNRMGLCGMLAADHTTLPKPMQDGICSFFDANESWLAELLRAGRQQGTLAFTGPPIEAARLLISALQGAMLLARAHADPTRLRSVATRLLAALTSPHHGK